MTNQYFIARVYRGFQIWGSMGKLGYRYEIIHKIIWNNNEIYEVKDTIYDTIVYLEKESELDSNNWDILSEEEDKLRNLKRDNQITDYFGIENYTTSIKTFYKVYEKKQYGWNFDNIEKIEKKHTFSEQEEIKEIKEIKENIEEKKDSVKRDAFYQEEEMEEIDEDIYYQEEEIKENILFQQEKLDLKKIKENRDDFFTDEKLVDEDIKMEHSYSHEYKYESEKFFINNESVELHLEKHHSKENLNNNERSEKIDIGRYKNSNIAPLSEKKKGNRVLFMIIFFFIIGGARYFIMMGSKETIEITKIGIKDSNYTTNEEILDDINHFSMGKKFQEKKDYKSANIEFKKACDSNNTRACNFLAYNYQHGNGVIEDVYKANKIYEKSCNLKSGHACMKLGFNYESGKGYKKKSKNRAFTYFDLGCEYNNKVACSKLADFYEKGIIVSKNRGKAIELYKKSCDLKYNLGCANLGYLYQNKLNIHKAIPLYIKSCELKSGWACLRLGDLYSKSRYINKDKEKAVLFYTKACDLKYKNSCKKIKKAKKLKISKKDQVSCKREDIQSVVYNNISSIRYCYDKEVVNNPSLKGSVKVSWEISSEGRAIKIKIVEDTMQNKRIENCIKRTISRLEFKKTIGSESCKVIYPFTFSL